MTPIRCLTAPNPGPFTHQGTNSWLVGAETLVLIDPGPDLAAHEAALLQEIAGRPVAAVLVTHAHRDHCALAPGLARRLGAPVLAAQLPFGGPAPKGRIGAGVDADFRPDQALHDGQVLSFGALSLTAWHTPGHLGGHFCFALGDRLFCGDHVMGWSSTVVFPPEGNMAAYRASLRRLAGQDWSRLLPGHGPEISDPAARLAELIAHRDLREAQILAALAAGPATPAEIALGLYPGLSPALLAAAEANVLAHLLELQDAAQVRALPGPFGILPQNRFARV